MHCTNAAFTSDNIASLEYDRTRLLDELATRTTLPPLLQHIATQITTEPLATQTASADTVATHAGTEAKLWQRNRDLPTAPVPPTIGEYVDDTPVQGMHRRAS